MNYLITKLLFDYTTRNDNSNISDIIYFIKKILNIFSLEAIILYIIHNKNGIFR